MVSYGRPVRLAVVIPARDEAPSIAETIAGARRAHPHAPDGRTQGDEAGLEIIVVDGGSLDHTSDRARAAGARVLHGQSGRARQLEAGWRATEAEIVLFLHADTELCPGAGAAIESALRDPGVVGGAFRLTFRERSAGLRVIEWGAALRHRLFGLPYGDQGLFVRRETLVAIGGVPQSPIMEDLDLVAKLRRRGRLVAVRLPVRTSARRYLANGVLRTWFRNTLALAAWHLGIDRERVAAWYRQ